MTALRLPMAEKEFQAQVLELARINHWLHYHTYRSRRSPEGFPDLVLVRDRVLYRELKTETGIVSDAQEMWLEKLAAAGADARVWRPSDFPEIERELAR